ncbi:hypothetical protein DQ244_12250 [Blastococcus sp. TBT05-19]|uniref:RipA family octameric membrane protein n=1 Tax=Blastococcus sp. TBT05-19 TaxID=2250581 RepID=UPI000DEB350A|nr:hypothetical protein [Blastococcus sp. TBT05-19]RBY90232.1 hypothetical protein DQ244_12250 [Blastococcus sp. TBT05-19]
MSGPGTGPGAAPDPRLLELYTLGAELADRVSARRATANSFFLTVQTTLIAVVGLIAPDLAAQAIWTSAVVAAAGVLLSCTWWLSLRSYRELNGAKFQVLHAMEDHLPVQLFRDEWAVLHARPSSWRSPRYSELGRMERWVPWVFALLWIGLTVSRTQA